MADLVPNLADLLDAPERALTLSQAEARALALKLAPLTKALDIAATAGAPLPNGDHASDGCISVDEAARLAGVSHDMILEGEAFRRARVTWGHKTRAVNKKKLLSIIEQRSGT